MKITKMLMKLSHLACLALLAFVSVLPVTNAQEKAPQWPLFKRHHIDAGANESAAVADFNRDGRLDIVSGENWFEAPDWKKHRIREINFQNGYVDNFSDMILDVNGDGFAELIAGGGPGGGPRVRAFNGLDLLAGTQNPIADFFAGDTNNRGGVRVSVKNLDSDNLADIVVGAGTGAGSRVTAYAGKAISVAAPPELFAFDAFAGFTGGVFVG